MYHHNYDKYTNDDLKKMVKDIDSTYRLLKDELTKHTIIKRIVLEFMEIF